MYIRFNSNEEDYARNNTFEALILRLLVLILQIITVARSTPFDNEKAEIIDDVKRHLTTHDYRKWG